MPAKIMPLWLRIALVLCTITGGLWIGQRLSPLTRISGNSMAPNIQSGEILAVNHHVRQPIPRSTVVIIARYASLPMIKRVVGLPHEKVSFKLGEVFVDGKMLYEPYISKEQTTFAWDQDVLTAGDGEYIVLGDNRLISQDSREFGPVSKNQIIGTIDLDCPPARLLSSPKYRILADTRHPQQAARKRTQPAQGPS